MENKNVLPDPTARLLTLYLVWLSFISAGLLLFVTGGLPESFIEPESVHFVLVESQILFLVIVWPLFLSGSKEGLFVQEPATGNRKNTKNREEAAEGPSSWYLQYGILSATLLLFSLPLVLLSANISGLGWTQVVKFQIVNASILIGTGLLWWIGGDKTDFWLQVYFSLVLLIGGGAPVMYALLRQSQNINADWLLGISPFTGLLWSGSIAGVAPWLFLSVLFITGCAILGLAVRGLLAFSGTGSRTRSSFA